VSDQEIGKKEGERIDLYPFLDAYQWATGERLSLLHCGESPDFICTRSNSREVGIEMAMVMRDKRDAFWQRILDKKVTMEPLEALDKIQKLIDRKEELRGSRYTKNVKNAILVLQLVDGSLYSLRFILKDLKGEFDSHGFCEVWLADYTGREAYGDIELFCLVPPERWGFYQRPCPYRKPYG
jgi:hypothetical protein